MPHLPHGALWSVTLWLCKCRGSRGCPSFRIRKWIRSSSAASLWLNYSYFLRFFLCRPITQDGLWLPDLQIHCTLWRLKSQQSLLLFSQPLSHDSYVSSISPLNSSYGFTHTVDLNVLLYICRYTNDQNMQLHSSVANAIGFGLGGWGWNPIDGWCAMVWYRKKKNKKVFITSATQSPKEHLSQCGLGLSPCTFAELQSWSLVAPGDCFHIWMNKLIHWWCKNYWLMDL